MFYAYKGDDPAVRLIIFVYIVLILSMFVTTIGTASADELHWSTDGQEPEKQWSPVPELLKKAYKISQTEADPFEHINRAANMCYAYIKAHPDDINGKVDAYVILTESYSNLGEYQTDTNDRIKAYEQAKALAQRVIDLAPDRWDGWYWWAASAGRIAQLKGIVESVVMFEPVKRHILKAYRLAPHSALVLDGLGFFYREVPWFAGGSLKKSKMYLQKALNIDPHLTLARLHLARTLLKDGDKAGAREELEILIHEEYPTWSAHYMWWDKPQAEQLLNKIK